MQTPLRYIYVISEDVEQQIPTFIVYSFQKYIKEYLYTLNYNDRLATCSQVILAPNILFEKHAGPQNVIYINVNIYIYIYILVYIYEQI